MYTFLICTDQNQKRCFFTRIFFTNNLIDGSTVCTRIVRGQGDTSGLASSTEKYMNKAKIKLKMKKKTRYVNFMDL